MELLEAMRTNRAVRRYRPDPVPDDVLARCLEAATWAASAGNRQPWRFCVLRSAEARSLLGPAYRHGWNRMAEGYGLTDVAPDDDSPRARMARSMWEFVERFEDVPAYVLFCLQGAPEELSVLDGASIYPAVQNFMLAARAEGLGTVMTTWFRFCEEDLRRLIGVPDDWMLAALTPVGWPVGGHGPVRRRPLADLSCLDQWDRPLVS